MTRTVTVTISDDTIIVSGVRHCDAGPESRIDSEDKAITGMVSHLLSGASWEMDRNCSSRGTAVWRRRQETDTAELPEVA